MKTQRKPLKPCGTFAAYQRHKRKNENPCQPCIEASREQKNERSNKKREEKKELIKVISIRESKKIEFEPLDELAEARENLALLKAAIKANPASGMAAMSKQYQELVAHIVRLEANKNGKGSVIDELNKRRAERIAKA